MSGTLIVQNLQGPASGANANKIIVPAGQVLDASAGFVAPAGSVIQVVYTNITTSFETTSGSWADVSNTSLSITPISASSKILVTYSAISLGTQGWSAVDVRLTDGVDIYGGVRQVARYDMQSNRTQYIFERHAFSQDWIINSWGTTSKTIKIQGKVDNGQSAGIQSPANDFYLIAMEIAG